MATDPMRGWRTGALPPLLLIGFAALVRIAPVVAYSGHLSDDRDDYWTVARSYVEHGFWTPFTRFPNSFRPPLLPLTLAAFLECGGGTVALGVLQVVLGVGSVALTLYTGRRLGLGRLSLVAAALVACDPLLIAYATFPMTETLFTFLVIALVAASTPELPPVDTVRALMQRPCVARQCRAAGIGLLFGLCALCRPTIWPAALFGAAWLAGRVLDKRERRLPIVLAAVTASLVCAAVVAPWALRNWKILGSPVVTTTHGGYTLLLGNNPDFFREVAARPLSELWRDREPDQFQQGWFARLVADRDREIGPHADELTQNRWMYQQAYKSILAEPRLFLRACALRFVLFWNVVPLVPSRSSLAHLVVWGLCAGYTIELGLFVLGLGSLVRHWDWRWAFLLCLILNFTVVHLVYWSNMRMRAPLVPLIALVGARGLSVLLDRRKVNKLVVADGSLRTS